MITTLDSSVIILPGRRSGNTTRQIDATIQWLFEGKEVLIIDHYNTSRSNRFLLERILTRLYEEHNISKENVIINFSTATIKLKK